MSRSLIPGHLIEHIHVRSDGNYTTQQCEEWWVLVDPPYHWVAISAQNCPTNADIPAVPIHSERFALMDVSNALGKYTYTYWRDFWNAIQII